MTDAGLGFVAGTMIATAKSRRAVQNFKIGDLVETLHGGIQPVKWIGRRSYDLAFLAENRALLPVLIKAGALDDNVPTHDLYLAPGHGICIDGALIPAFRLINGVTIERDELAGDVEYIHLELDEHEVLIAEGCGAESFIGDALRPQFENAAEYHLRYPEPLPWPPVPCLERIDQGFVLDSIQQRLNERAGIAPVDPVEGPLRGFVDIAGPERVSGWAQNEAQPEFSVCLDILVDGIRVMRALANQYREDLQALGIGSGNHAFDVALPERASGQVEIRRTIDQAPLPLTDDAAARQVKTPPLP
jgi:hypothetical protein